MAEGINLCKICENAPARYSCPKCNILYCSLICYKSEGHIQCSENFYKDCVYENLNIEEGYAEGERKMCEILKRVYETNESHENLDSDDEEDLLDIHERLAGVNLDDTEKVWEKLTLDEKQEFEAFLRSDDISKIIPKWEPWWMYFSNRKVLELSEVENHKKKCPTVAGNVPNFKSIFKSELTDILKYNLINVLSAYAFTVRYFNGDHHDFVDEAVSYIVNLSLNLKKGVNFESFTAAVDSIQQECISNEWVFADKENIELMKNDLEMILRGPHLTDHKFYVLCSLSDIYQLLKLTITQDTADKVSDIKKVLPESQFPTVYHVEKDKLKSIKKKIEFYMAYTKDCLQM